MSVNGEAVNVTSKDSGGWREPLSGAVRADKHDKAEPTRRWAKSGKAIG